MHKSIGNRELSHLVDEYGNYHQVTDELARGGQGVVFRTKDKDLAIKQPLDAYGRADTNADLRERFQNIRVLPIPSRIPVSLPLAILRDEPGYVMRLLSDMKPFASFELNGKIKREMVGRSAMLPNWLRGISDEQMALLLQHYASTGSTRRRLFALAKCAAILARLHYAGLVYGDISTNNAFVRDHSACDVWLIDADNMRFELPFGGVSVYTPSYGAPEVVQGRDQSRPRTDCWAFAVMAFKLLAMCHPFVGKKVLQAEDNDDGWDAEPVGSDGGVANASIEEQAYAGRLPFVDDEDDTSNEGVCGLPRALVTTQELRQLFQRTFGAGRQHPHSRPVMAFWALELAKAADYALDCPECAMSYFALDHVRCPYCQSVRPAFIRVQTPRWEIVLPASTKEWALPHRLFYPFSFEQHDDVEHDAWFSFSSKTAVPARGAKAFPDNLTFKFVEGSK